MRTLKPVLSIDAPNIKDALWIQPVNGGLEIKVLEGGQWKSATIEKHDSFDLKALSDGIVGKKGDKASAMTLYGLKKYIDEQIEALSV